MRPTPFQAMPFRPPVWLRNRHAQTIYASLFGESPDIDYRRERLDTSDGDFLLLDWTAGQKGKPIVLLCHGLEGCSRSAYAQRLMRSVEQRGWNGVTLNFRMCAGEPNRLARSYHSGETGDLRFVVEHIAKRYPDAPLALAGFSLGGNVLCKYLGEQGSDVSSRIKAACGVSVPFDLQAAQEFMDTGFSRIYVWKFLRTLCQKARVKARQFPGTFDETRVARAWSFREFDDAFTAPAHGFEDYVDYYTRSSSKPFLAMIQVPTLLLAAKDDPFVPERVLPTSDEVSGTVTRLFLESGGHVAFYDANWKCFWMCEQILRWFERFMD